MQNPARGPWNLVLSVRSFVWAAKEPLKEPCCCPSLPSDRAFTAGALGSVQPTSPYLKKLEIELPYDPAIPLLSIHTEETRIERDTCTPMFIPALFIIARAWKQPRCPSADEWIRKLWYIYTMEYYTAIKKNTFESVLIRWMKLEPIIQSEVSQKEKHQ